VTTYRFSADLAPAGVVRTQTRSHIALDGNSTGRACNERHGATKSKMGFVDRPILS